MHSNQASVSYSWVTLFPISLIHRDRMGLAGPVKQQMFCSNVTPGLPKIPSGSACVWSWPSTSFGKRGSSRGRYDFRGQPTCHQKWRDIKNYIFIKSQNWSSEVTPYNFTFGERFLKEHQQNTQFKKNIIIFWYHSASLWLNCKLLVVSWGSTAMKGEFKCWGT